MSAKNYLVIKENVVTDIVVWDGNVATWTPPTGTIALAQESTPTKIWRRTEDFNDYELVDSTGDACIGFTYDGSACVTNETKPEVPTGLPIGLTREGQIPVTNTGA